MRDTCLSDFPVLGVLAKQSLSKPAELRGECTKEHRRHDSIIETHSLRSLTLPWDGRDRLMFHSLRLSLVSVIHFIWLSSLRVGPKWDGIMCIFNRLASEMAWRGIGKWNLSAKSGFHGTVHCSYCGVCGRSNACDNQLSRSSVTRICSVRNQHTYTRAFACR
jgi:hypothetical protein